MAMMFDNDRLRAGTIRKEKCTYDGTEPECKKRVQG